MKTVAPLCALMLFGASMHARSDEAPRDRRDDPIVIAIDYTKDLETGSWVTCVTCSVKQSTNERDTLEPTGKGWIEIIDLPAPGIKPNVRARREAIPTIDPNTGRLHFYGFFPGLHGPRNGSLPNLIIELKPKGEQTSGDVKHTRLSTFRPLTEQECVEELKNIDVPPPAEKLEPRPAEPKPKTEPPKQKPRRSSPQPKRFAFEDIA